MTYAVDKYGQHGPSASYAFEYNRMINAGASPEQAHEAGVKAHEAAVWGADAKKDRNGKWIPQGIGAKGFETGNHFASLKKAEQQGLEPPGSYDRAVAEIYRRDPDRARSIGLPPPERAA
jgi:hypothetical protein